MHMIWQWRAGARVDQPRAGGLQPAYDHRGEPSAELVPEERIGVAGRAHRRGFENEGLRRLCGYGAKTPLIWRKHPRQAGDVAPAERLDDPPALARHARVQRHLAGIDHPEPVGPRAFTEQPLPRW